MPLQKKTEGFQGQVESDTISMVHTPASPSTIDLGAGADVGAEAMMQGGPRVVEGRNEEGWTMIEGHFYCQECTMEHKAGLARKCCQHDEGSVDGGGGGHSHGIPAR